MSRGCVSSAESVLIAGQGSDNAGLGMVREDTTAGKPN